jgi:hypothetical protein
LGQGEGFDSDELGQRQVLRSEGGSATDGGLASEGGVASEGGAAWDGGFGHGEGPRRDPAEGRDFDGGTGG